MKKYDDYIDIVKKAVEHDIKKIELVTDANNVVFKAISKTGQILYAKFYSNKSSHIDHEMNLYDIVDSKYLKDVVYSSKIPRYTIFKEVRGKTIDELSGKELEMNKERIIDSLIDFFKSMADHKLNGYGLVDENFQGEDASFQEFIVKRQTETQNVLKDYPLLSNLFTKIYTKYKHLIIEDNCIVPIDTNMKNIMMTENNEIKFIDPGEIISAPILMGYGDFVAHAYKTSLYDCLMKKLKLNKDDEKRLRIYAIFSSLNILAFLTRMGVRDVSKVIPYGNRYTFFELIKSHMDSLEIKDFQ